MAVSVRPLETSDVKESSRLHYQVLDMEFLSRCGERFLRGYHRAWLDSVDALAIAAVDDRGDLVGVLLGAVRPERHFRAMVRRHGAALAFFMTIHALSNPRFFKELLVTRGLRYSRGLLRILVTSVRRPGRMAPGGAASPSSGIGDSGTDPGLLSGEVTHLMVRSDAQGEGVGRALLEEAGRSAKVAGLDELLLVTPPDLAAGNFYEHLGWHRAGKLTSRSGEEFIRYRLPIDR
jgi:GNAT superfamily N-acetyltransferase